MAPIPEEKMYLNLTDHEPKIQLGKDLFSTKDFNKICRETLAEYNQIIESIGSVNINNWLWWSTTLSSRNPIESPFFQRKCKKRYLDNIIASQGTDILVLTDDRVLNQILQIYYPSVKVKYFPRLFTRIKQNLGSKKYILIELFNSVLLKIMFSILPSPFDLKNGNRLIYIPICSKEFLIKGFVDRFFSSKSDGFWKSLNCQIIPSFDLLSKPFSTFKILNRSNFPLVARENLLTFRDYALITYSFLIKSNIETSSLCLSNSDLYFAKKELKELKYAPSRLQSIINYYLGNRIARTLKPTSIILWYENHSSNKLLIKGIRNVSIGIKLIGYQCFIDSYLTTSLNPTKFEYQAQVAPTTIGFMGDIRRQQLLEGSFPKTRTISAPPTRFEYINQLELNHRPLGEKPTIGIALSGDQLPDSQLYSLIHSIASTNFFRILIKPHPFHTYKIKGLKREFSTKIDFYTGNNHDFFQNIDIVFSMSGSIVVEALSLGITTIVLVDRFSQFCDFDFGKYTPRHYIKVYSIRETLFYLEQLQKSHDLFKCSDRDLRSFKNHLVNCPRQNTFESFIESAEQISDS